MYYFRLLINKRKEMYYFLLLINKRVTIYFISKYITILIIFIANKSIIKSHYIIFSKYI